MKIKIPQVPFYFFTPRCQMLIEIGRSAHRQIEFTGGALVIDGKDGQVTAHVEPRTEIVREILTLWAAYARPVYPQKYPLPPVPLTGMQKTADDVFHNLLGGFLIDPSEYPANSYERESLEALIKARGVEVIQS